MSKSKAKYVAKNYRTRKRVQIKCFLNKLILKQAVRKMKMLGNNKMSLILTKNLDS